MPLRYQCQLPSLHLPRVDTGSGIQPSFLWSMAACSWENAATGFLTVPHGCVLLDHLEKMALYSSHPMFLLLMFYNNLVACLSKTTKQCKDRSVEVDTYFARSASAHGSFGRADALQHDFKTYTYQFDECDRKITEIHAMVTDIQWDLVKELQDVLVASMKTFPDNSLSRRNHELNEHFNHIRKDFIGLLFERNRYLMLVNTKRQLLYSRMQANHTSMMQREASRTKVTSLLGVVVLPTTAVAAFFNMTPFFTPVGDTFVINPDIWTFCAAAAALTAVVFFVYTTHSMCR